MKKMSIIYIFLLVCNTATSMDRHIIGGQAEINGKILPLCISQDPQYCLNLAQRTERKGERCISKSKCIHILAQKEQCILSTTDFNKDYITTALLALHHNGTWYAALQCYRNNQYEEHIKELMYRLTDVVATSQSIELIRFITVSKKTDVNTAASRLLHNHVIRIVERIQKPLQVWSFDYNEEKAVPFSKEKAKDVEIYLNPNGTGFLYLNTTKEYIPLPYCPPK